MDKHPGLCPASPGMVAAASLGGGNALSHGHTGDAPPVGSCSRPCRQRCRQRCGQRCGQLCPPAAVTAPSTARGGFPFGGDSRLGARGLEAAEMGSPWRETNLTAFKACGPGGHPCLALVQRLGRSSRPPEEPVEVTREQIASRRVCRAGPGAREGGRRVRCPHGGMRGRAAVCPQS